jgi:hypothetical protein
MSSEFQILVIIGADVGESKSMSEGLPLSGVSVEDD